MGGQEEIDQDDETEIGEDGYKCKYQGTKSDVRKAVLMILIHYFD